MFHINKLQHFIATCLALSRLARFHNRPAQCNVIKLLVLPNNIPKQEKGSKTFTLTLTLLISKNKTMCQLCGFLEKFGNYVVYFSLLSTAHLATSSQKYLLLPKVHFDATESHSESWLYYRHNNPQYLQCKHFIKTRYFWQVNEVLWNGAVNTAVIGNLKKPILHFQWKREKMLKRCHKSSILLYDDITRYLQDETNALVLHEYTSFIWRGMATHLT